MTTAVLLAFINGGKDFIDEAHVHGFRDGALLVARGAPGAGLAAEVVRVVPVVDLAFAENCEKDDTTEDEASNGPWSLIRWPKS